MRQEEPAISIRSATAGTFWNALRKLLRLIAIATRPDAFVDTVLTPKSLGRRLATMSVFVAVNVPGEVIGTVACNVVNQGKGHVRGMAVRPAWHGRSVATLLLAGVEAEFRKLQMFPDHPGHHGAAAKRHAFQQKTWLHQIGQSRGLLRDGALRICQDTAHLGANHESSALHRS